jgi:hypothetical protein
MISTGINPVHISKGRKDGKDHIVKNVWYNFCYTFIGLAILLYGLISKYDVDNRSSGGALYFQIFEINLPFIL